MVCLIASTAAVYYADQAEVGIRFYSFAFTFVGFSLVSSARFLFTITLLLFALSLKMSFLKNCILSGSANSSNVIVNRTVVRFATYLFLGLSRVLCKAKIN